MNPLKTYACYNKNNELRIRSSSGAVFSSLAKYVFEKQGIVYGVAMTSDCYAAEFISVTNENDLAKLRGSKYLQAKVGIAFKSIKNDLLSGKTVLFTGTGCQVNGLKKFLGKEYDNLICVDVICHGAPSPALWKKYAQYQEQRNDGKLKNINFRCKDNGWTDFGMQEALEDTPDGNTKKLLISKDEDFYMQMFLRNYCLRPSCYDCVAKKQKMSDLTIADFWGINNVAPEMSDGLGTSLVLIRTIKGQDMFNHISSELKLKEVTYEAGVKENSAEYRSCTRPQQRNTFFDDMNNMSFEELGKEYATPVDRTFKGKIKRKIKNIIKNIGGEQRVIQNTDYSLCFVFDCKEEHH